MNRVIKAYDKLSMHQAPDKGGLRGRVIIGKGRYQKPVTGPDGKIIYTSELKEVLSDDTNIVPIGGYQYAFSKMFNIALDDESTLRVGHLNDEAPQMRIGVSRGNYISQYYNAETSIGNSAMSPNGGINIPAMNHIFGFMIGDGGCREDNITVIAPNYKNRGLFHAVPFRMSNDGFALPEDIYFGKSVQAANSSGITIDSYYIKRFDSPQPHIVHSWVTDSSEIVPVDDTVFSSTSSTAIESYVEMNLTISAQDARGYFTTNDATPRINEIGLVAGWYNGQEKDYEQLMLITHYCRSSITLDDGDAIEVIYRLYAR